MGSSLLALEREELSWPAHFVVRIQCQSAVLLLINVYIVVKELRCRFRGEAEFTTWALKWFSLMSISSGLVVSFFSGLIYVDYTCYVMYTLTVSLIAWSPIPVGLYQLSRLHQCFAGKKVSGGYPKWVFFIMRSFGVLWSFTYITARLIGNRKVTECGLVSFRSYKYHEIHYFWDIETRAKFDSATAIQLMLWEMTTLSLLIFKLRSFTAVKAASSEKVVIGIRRKMTRIVILTILYLSTGLITVIINYLTYSENPDALPLNHGLWMVQVTIVSYAVFLMQQHNSRDYGRFLKILICLKMHYFCCCFHSAVKAQRDHFLPKYEAIYDMEMEQSLLNKEETIKDTATAFNDFSMNEPPNWSPKYRPPTSHLIVNIHSDLQRSDSLQTPREFLFGEHLLQTVTEDVATPTTPSNGDVLTSSLSGAINQSVSANNINDFLFDAPGKSQEEFSSGFSFGVYLEYWRPNRHNSVVPRYKSLKKELTRNRHATITEEQYERVKRQCIKLQKEHTFTAKNIGFMNSVCGILPGTEMTVDHMICMKLYTDFTEQQAVFKRHCRRLYQDEPVESVMKRNREIAHWCRLLRECIMFYGESMRACDVVYCGLSAHLIFRTLNARFECPLSTTKTKSVAQQFSEGKNGIILKLKRANPKTRCLNVAPFTVFQNENERLFSGSTLKIIDILIQNGFKMTSLKRYLNALQMLEEIANGYFISGGHQTRMLLSSLLTKVVDPSVMDALGASLVWCSLRRDLDDEGYDTDALFDDVEDIEDSNAMESADQYGDSLLFLELIQSTLGNLLDIDSIPKYVWYLFINFLDEMKVMMEKGTLWMNHNELDKNGLESIKAVLFGDNQLFDVLSIEKDHIPRVQQYQWMITGKSYEKLRSLPVSGYIASPQFTYEVPSEFDGHHVIFHFRFYGQYSEEEPQCAIFLELDDIPDGVKRVRIEVDMKCYKKLKFRHLLRSRILSKEQRMTGFITFDHEEVDRNKNLQWVFGVKIFKVEKEDTDEE